MICQKIRPCFEYEENKLIKEKKGGKNMYEKQICEYLRNLGLQLQNQQALIINLKSAISNMRINGSTNTVTRTVIVGVKDITTAQLYDAYRKGLNMEQLVQLADGKYTAEQIYKKLQKIGGDNL